MRKQDLEFAESFQQIKKFKKEVKKVKRENKQNEDRKQELESAKGFGNLKNSNAIFFLFYVGQHDLPISKHQVNGVKFFKWWFHPLINYFCRCTSFFIYGAVQCMGDCMSLALHYLTSRYSTYTQLFSGPNKPLNKQPLQSCICATLPAFYIAHLQGNQLLDQG